MTVRKSWQGGKHGQTPKGPQEVTELANSRALKLVCYSPLSAAAAFSFLLVRTKDLDLVWLVGLGSQGLA